MAPGAVAKFQAKATGDALQFQWQKNRKEILSDGGRYCDTETNTLRIEEVEETDKGRYRCIVTTKNDARKKFSKEAYLTISSKYKSGWYYWMDFALCTYQFDSLASFT